MKNYPDQMKAWLAIVLIGLSILLITSGPGFLPALGMLFLSMGLILWIIDAYLGSGHHRS
jgi:hypothetical protein